MNNGDALMSYDPDYDGEENAMLIHDAIQVLAEKINAVEPGPQEILNVVQGPEGPAVKIQLCERDARILRFALGLVLETF